MNDELHGEVLEALRERADWDEKQRVWYLMAHDGLRRQKPPFRGAADLHYPLVDGAIQKFEPFYFNQMFTGEVVAEFAAQRQEAEAVAASAAQWFDYKIKRSNLAEKLLSATYTMLLRQRGVVKCVWEMEVDSATEAQRHGEGDSTEQISNSIAGVGEVPPVIGGGNSQLPIGDSRGAREKKGKLAFAAVDLVHVIMAPGALDFEDADWWVQVKKMSRRKFARDGRYGATCKTKEILDRLAGGQRAAGNGENVAAEQDKKDREGITWCAKGEIIVWERWEKTSEGWIVSEYCPVDPGVQLRAPQKCPYLKNGRQMQPFVALAGEIADEGWYAPRGLAERLAHFEAALCQMWNFKHDAIKFSGRPMFKSATKMPNTMNINFAPGELLPEGVEPVVMPTPPISFDEEMSLQRMTADDYVALPDAGLQPDASKGGQGKDVTATQVNYQAQIQGATTNLRGFIFRLGLQKIYEKAWALLVQFGKEDAAYFVGRDLKTVPQEALGEFYELTPAGPIDAWNKAATIQRAANRFQVFNRDPMINQEELRKDVLSAEDPRLVKRLLLPTGLAEGLEGREGAVDVMLLMGGYPAPVKPGDDHLTRIKVAMGKLEQLGHTGEPVDPIAVKRLHEYVAVHLQYLAQESPKVAKDVEKAIAMAEQGGVGGMREPGVPPGAAVAEQPMPGGPPGVG